MTLTPELIEEARAAAPFEPGVYEMPADEYHADPVPGGSLSSTGVRKLLDCPARFRYDTDHPPESTAVFDFGHAAHRLALGHGAAIEVVDADNWRTKAAQELRNAAHAAGHTPLLRADFDAVKQMAAALSEHPIAGPLLARGHGRPEQSLFWQSAGVWCRARVDFLPDGATGGRPNGMRRGRLVVPDYKTAVSVKPEDLRRAVLSHGYHIQLAWYLRGLRALTIAPDDAVMVLVCQEKTPPYLVTVVQLDDEAMRTGSFEGERALNIYRDCAESRRWPGYTDEVEVLSLPPWAAVNTVSGVW